LVSISWSASNTTVPAAPESISGQAVMPNPGAESPGHDPFTLYDTGPFPWSYDQLETDALKAQVDRGRDVTGWSSIHNGYASAVQDAAAAAQAEAAQHQIGIENPGATGVVP
jgi:hypothetical protein